MHRYVALLRAVNVGGRVVKMDRLRALFEELGFFDVASYIASGNIVFGTPSTDIATLARTIEQHLKQSLGYDVVTFIRTPKQLKKIVDMQPFPASEMDDGTRLFIGFLSNAPKQAAKDKLMSFSTHDSELRVREREVYWLLRTAMQDSSFSSAKMERALGMPVTLRNITTVRKLADFAASGSAVVAGDEADEE